MKAYRSCPSCGSFNVRVSHHRNARELLQSFFGFQKMRCRECGKRFPDHAFHWPQILYARCPKCQEMELRDWQEKYYYPPRYKRLLTYVGARQQRCEKCRYNFISFRPRWKRG